MLDSLGSLRVFDGDYFGVFFLFYCSLGVRTW